LFGLFIGSTHAQVRQQKDEIVTRILFVFDGSQSMYARWESGTKIDIAQRLMTKMLDSLQSLKSDRFQLGLRVYGHQRPVPPQDCNDTKLEVPLGYNNFNRLKKTLRSIKPKGTTPIARSLLRSANDFPPCENCRNIIILITDGVESCDEDPCAASRRLQQQGIILKPFVIGIGLDKGFQQSFSCVGNFYDAADEKTFQNILGIVISQALDNTTAQINLLDVNNIPSETDVPITFYNMTSGKVSKQIVHTLNYLGNPDTVYLDPLVTYKMTVHSLPEVSIENIRIAPGKHNSFGTPLARGTLELKMQGARNGYEHLKCLVKKKGTNEIIHVQEFGLKQKYLQGFYDLEFLTLPRIKQDNVSIKGNETTSISLPPPGVAKISSSIAGYGSVLVQNGDTENWVIDLDKSLSNQSFTLQPGNYRVVFRSKTSQKSEYSISKAFTVTSGSITIVKLN
jgi:Ca-activated chloride channel family protein